MESTLGLKTFGLLAAVIVAFAAYSVARAADDEQWPPPGVSFYGDPKVPDISGVWLGTLTGLPGERFQPGRGPADGRPPTYWAPLPLPYTPPYQKIFEERTEAAKKGRQLGDNSAKCLPFGVPQMLVSKVYADEIVQTPGQVTIFVQATIPIVIWTGGRGHPKDAAPRYNGHSIGYWLGDTLFVDTVGIVESTALDVRRNPHSAKLHIKWTMQRVAKDTLHLHITLYDEDAFTEPVVTTNIWQRKTDASWQLLDDGSCFENNKNLPGAGGAPGFIKF